MDLTEERTTYQHYEVQRREDGSLHELGRGAMGITYKALDTNLHVPVALKVITGVLLPDAKARLRFLREARAAAQLRHSNVATVYHLGQEADFCFYTMEFIEGETLEARVRRDGPMDAAVALNVCQQTVRALQAAHARGLLHRDLKPSNLMLTTEGEEMLVKVIDFGLVKPLQQDNPDASGASLSGSLFLGTPLYASPEQCAAEDTIDGRADLYSLGATLWFMLTGGPPFKGSMRTVMTQHLTKLPDFGTLSGQPPAVVALLRDLLAKEAEDRLANATVLRARIAEVLPTLETGGPRAATLVLPPPLPPQQGPADVPASSVLPVSKDAGTAGSASDVYSATTIYEGQTLAAEPLPLPLPVSPPPAAVPFKAKHGKPSAFWEEVRRGLLGGDPALSRAFGELMSAWTPLTEPGKPGGSGPMRRLVRRLTALVLLPWSVLLFVLRASVATFGRGGSVSRWTAKQNPKVRFLVRVCLVILGLKLFFGILSTAETKKQRPRRETVAASTGVNAGPSPNPGGLEISQEIKKKVAEQVERFAKLPGNHLTPQEKKNLDDAIHKLDPSAPTASPGASPAVPMDRRSALEMAAKQRAAARELKRRALETRHRDGQLSDEEYQDALEGLEDSDGQ